LRKNKPTIHDKEQLTIYNKAIKQARQTHFSKIITDNHNDPKKHRLSGKVSLGLIHTYKKKKKDDRV